MTESNGTTIALNVRLKSSDSSAQPRAVNHEHQAMFVIAPSKGVCCSQAKP